MLSCQESKERRCSRLIEECNNIDNSRAKGFEDLVGTSEDAKSSRCLDIKGIKAKWIPKAIWKLEHEL